MTTLLWTLAAVASAAVMMVASRFALTHAIAVASGLRVPPFLVGITLVAIGTDIPELVNSVTSSYLGHGDINVGDSIGSVFTQGSLMLGLMPFVAASAFSIQRRQIALLTSLSFGALGVVGWAVGDGLLSRLDAGLLILVWALATALLWRFRSSTPETSNVGALTRGVLAHVTLAVLALALVGAAATVLVTAVVTISATLGVPEYVIAFFGASLGTSLPELIVEFTALRKGQREMAMGDALGSCLVDASLSVALGPLLFPTSVTADLAIQGAIMAAAAMLLAGSLLTLRGKHDRYSGIVLVAAYLGAYFLVLMPR